MLTCDTTVSLSEVRIASAGEPDWVGVQLHLSAPAENVELVAEIEGSVQALVSHWSHDHGKDAFTLRCKIEGPGKRYVLGGTPLAVVDIKSLAIKIDESGKPVAEWVATSECPSVDAIALISCLGEVALVVEDLQQELPLAEVR
jgi:hypothetical protein